MKPLTNKKAQIALLSNILSWSKKIGLIKEIDGIKYIKEVRLYNGSNELRELCRSLGINDNGYNDLTNIENQEGVKAAYLNFTSTNLKTSQMMKLFTYLKNHFSGKIVEIKTHKDTLGNYNPFKGTFTKIYDDLPPSLSKMFYVMGHKWGWWSNYTSTAQNNIQTATFLINIPTLSLSLLSSLDGVDQDILIGEMIINDEGDGVWEEEYEYLKDKALSCYMDKILSSTQRQILSKNGLRIDKLRLLTLEDTLDLFNLSMKIRIKRDEGIWWRRVVGQFLAVVDKISIGTVKALHVIPVLGDFLRLEDRIIGHIFNLSPSEVIKMEARLAVTIYSSILTGGSVGNIFIGKASSLDYVMASIDLGKTAYLTHKQILNARVEQQLFSDENSEDYINSNVLYGAMGEIGTGISTIRNVRQILKGRRHNDRYFK